MIEIVILGLIPNLFLSFAIAGILYYIGFSSISYLIIAISLLVFTITEFMIRTLVKFGNSLIQGILMTILIGQILVGLVQAFNPSTDPIVIYLTCVLPLMGI